jgi:O-antigen/teichoic acid export membrane protein
MNCTISPAEVDHIGGLQSALPTDVSAPSDRKSLLSRGLISLFDQIVVSGCTFFTMYLVSQNCSKADVGTFALAATVINFIRTVQERAIAAPYLAFAYQPGFKRNSFRGSSFMHQGVLSFVVAILAIAAVGVGWGLGVSSPILAVVASLVVTLPLLMIRDQIRAISAANFEFIPQLVLDIAVGFVQFGGLFFLAWANQFSIAYVYVALGLACAIPCLAWFWQHRASLEIDRTSLLSDWNHNWRYSRWLVGARVLGIFGYLAVPWIVAYFLDKSETGAFAVCSSLVGISLMFVTGLNNLFQPRTIRELHRSGMRGMKSTLVESIVVVSGVLCAISIGFALFGDIVLELLFGPAYRSYGHIAFLLSLSTLTVSFSVLFGNGLAALGNSRQYFWGEFACCAVSVSSAALLIPWLGLAGAAQSLIFGGIAASVVTGLTLVRAIPLYEPSEAVSKPSEAVSKPVEATI